MGSPLSLAAFQRYCQEHTHTAEASDLLARIRSSGPARRVQGRAGNVSGFFPSRKMGVAIQFESSVELGAIYLMETDESVLEFYDQPYTFKLKYLDKSGKRLQGHYYTPDFLVLRRSGVEVVEWKTEKDLQKLVLTHPHRYQQSLEGIWGSKPALELFAPYSFSFQVCSSAQLPRTRIDNLDFLTDYFISSPILPPAIVSSVQKCLRALPGMTIAMLLSETPGLRPNDIYTLIAQDQVFVDLDQVSLRDHYHTQVFPDVTSAKAHAQLGLGIVSRTQKIAEPVVAPISASTRFLWDGRLWTLVNLGETTTTLLPEKGEPLQLPSSFFLHLLETHTISIPSSETVTEAQAEAESLWASASKADMLKANERFRFVSAYLEQDGELLASAPVTLRTIRRWVQAFQAAHLSFGMGYLGLLPSTALRGNRQPRAPKEARVLLLDFITKHYETTREPHAWEVYLAYQRECEKRHLLPLSSHTFYRQIRKRRGHAQTEARQGAKAAYRDTPWILELTRETPRHGNRPFAIVHLDHTELDVMLVSSVTGNPLGKPWVTFLVDAYSRRLLSVYLTFDPPSYRSCMMALRICVQRFGRLPSALVVDGGREFHSTYFDTLLLRYQTMKKSRPGAKPRFGSVIERLFGTTNTEFVYNLLGNTQAAKRPRQLTRAVDPKRNAVWCLADLYDFLCEWAYDVYDQTPHPALFQSPREAFVQRLVETGEREHRTIPYAEEFLMASSPTTRKGTAKVERGRGIKIHGMYYSALQLRSPDVEGTSVEVRYDPFDIGIAYAFAKNRWVRCVSQYYTFLQGHSEKELMLASKEIRQSQRLHTKNRVVTARHLADFLAHTAEHEALRQQRMRDFEAKTILEAISGTQIPIAGEGSDSGPEATPLSLTGPMLVPDFTSLVAFEEYE